MPQFPYLVSDLLYDIVETVNKKNYRLYENYRLLSVASMELFGSKPRGGLGRPWVYERCGVR